MLQNKLSKHVLLSMAFAALITTVGVGALSYANATQAADDTSTTASVIAGQDMRMKPGVGGSITAISGTSITVTGKDSTTYTIDASSAKVLKATEPTEGAAPQAPTTIAVADLKVGDMIMVKGTLTGTNVVATEIFSGKMFGRGGPGGHHGQGGTVSAINGSTLTIDGRTVDVTGAKIMRLSEVTASEVKVGDKVMIQK